MSTSFVPSRCTAFRLLTTGSAAHPGSAPEIKTAEIRADARREDKRAKGADMGRWGERDGGPDAAKNSAATTSRPMVPVLRHLSVISFIAPVQ